MLTLNHLKTFYSALVQKLKRHRGNWKQNDPTADDYIKNRPFYEEILNYTFDGNVDGKETVMLSDPPVTFVKISDDVLSADDLIGTTMTVNGEIENNFPLPAETILDSTSVIDNGDGSVFVSWGIPFIISITKAMNFMDISFPSAGLYVLYIPVELGLPTPVYCSKLKKEVVHKLDKKFVDMPDDIMTEETMRDALVELADSLYFKSDIDGLASHEYSWDGTLTDEYLRFNAFPHYKVSDVVLPYEIIAAETSTSPIGTFSELWKGENCYHTSAAVVVTKAGECRLAPDSATGTPQAFSAPSTGVYFYYRPDSGFHYTNLHLAFATNSYVPSGSTIVSVGNDETGRPITWKCASIPSKTSDLVNDSGFITNEDIEGLGSAAFTETTDYMLAGQVIDGGAW